MVTLETPVCDFGKPAIDFTLLGVDGKNWTLQDCMGEKGLLVMFICNHCPYVKAVKDRIVRDTNELKALGINSVAIMPNDVANYPDDSLENMKKLSDELQFSFPYLITPILNCNTEAVLIQVAEKSHLTIHHVIYLKRCN